MNTCDKKMTTPKAAHIYNVLTAVRYGVPPLLPSSHTSWEMLEGEGGEIQAVLQPRPRQRGLGTLLQVPPGTAHGTVPTALPTLCTTKSNFALKAGMLACLQTKDAPVAKPHY